MNRFFAIMSLCALAVTGVLMPAPAHAATDQLCFNVPGITDCIAGRFREYWQQNGGLEAFGYPLTPARYERSLDTGPIYLTQWFERNTFELHPENARPYDVLLGRLADIRLSNQLNRFWIAEPTASGPEAGCTWFGQTSHNVCDQAPNLGFQHYLLTHGLNFDDNRAVSAQESLALIGLPLTEAHTETNASGDTVITQWFERARLEWHPDKQDQYKVLLGLLGSEVRTFVPPLKTNCEHPVVPELRRHYQEARGLGDLSLRQALGCPEGSIAGLRAAVESFEGGTMLWHEPTTTHGSPPASIYVIFGDARPPRYIDYDDGWQEGQPEPAGATPPAGKYAPRRGFGKVWREESGVRPILGWATQPEQAEQATEQDFEHGFMLWLHGSDVVYVFSYSDSATFSQRLK